MSSNLDRSSGAASSLVNRWRGGDGYQAQQRDEDDEDLCLVVQNTFLEARSKRPATLAHSKSDSCVASSSSSSGWGASSASSISSEKAELPYREASPRPFKDTQHLVIASSQSEESSQSDARNSTVIPDMSSEGSKLHSEGLCKPCGFIERNRCVKGMACKFCHILPHAIPQRKGKQSRDRAKIKAEKRAQDQGILPPPDSAQ